MDNERIAEERFKRRKEKLSGLYNRVGCAIAWTVQPSMVRTAALSEIFQFDAFSAADHRGCGMYMFPSVIHVVYFKNEAVKTHATTCEETALAADSYSSKENIVVVRAYSRIVRLRDLISSNLAEPDCQQSIFFLWPWLRGSEEVEQALFVSPLRNGIASCAGTHENSRDVFTTNRDRGVGFHESTISAAVSSVRQSSRLLIALCVIDFNLWNKVPYSVFRLDLPSYRILRDELHDQIVQQHSTSNKHLDIVHGLEALETPPEAYQAFLMPMTLPRLPRELTMKWKRGRTDEKNSLKELLTFLKAEIRIRERYGSFDSSARVDSEIQACIIKELYKATLHRARSLHIENGNLNNAPAMNFLHTESGDSSMAKTTMVQQHSTNNEQLDIVHGLEALEIPPEAYQTFLMPMTLPHLPRELTMKWKRGRTDEKNSVKELLTFLKAEIRIRERYGSFDSSARVDSEIQVLLMEKKMHLKKNIPWLLFIRRSNSHA
ncbi:hypothetical protein T11_558 [Trichinella zimbabwensis]|uniref:Uncharacterized protein n=1 Tax=Trichinella zimbabwensis TaxID=268475 RepID=A0A0V1GUA3_9BILA|nr:hypothetical protein T11_558 [Trichinella zimbabwensis]